MFDWKYKFRNPARGSLEQINENGEKKERCGFIFIEKKTFFETAVRSLSDGLWIV